MLFRLLQVLLIPIVVPLIIVEQLPLLLVMIVIITIPYYIIVGTSITTKQYNRIRNNLPFTLIGIKILP